MTLTKGGALPVRVSGGIRPAARLNLVHRIDEDEVLHVRVLLEDRRRERLSRRAQSRRQRMKRPALDRRLLDEALCLQLVEHTAYDRVQFLPRRLVPRLERIDDLGACRLSLDRRPDLGPRITQAVVRTRSQVDDDRLALDRLGDRVLAAHTETLSHRSRPQTPLPES